MFNPDSLVLVLRTSRLQLALLFVITLSGLVAIWTNPQLSVALSLFLTLALALSCVDFAWHEVFRRSGDAITGVQFGEGRWKLTLRDGRVEHAQFLGAYFTRHAFVLLLFRGKSIGRRSVLIAADTMAADDFRRLRVMMRLGGYQPNEGGVSTVSAALGSRFG